MRAPYTFELRVRTVGGADLRAVTGARLQIEQRNLKLPCEGFFQHDVIGSGWASDGFNFDGLAADVVTSWDLEIGDSGDDIADHVVAAVATLLPEAAATELANLAKALTADPMPWHAEWTPPVGPGLAEQRAAWFDVLVPSVNWREGDSDADPVTHFRRARLVWAPNWCVTIWSPRSADLASTYQTWGLPSRAPMRAADLDGNERATEALRSILKHVEWSVDMVDLELESWETQFLDAGATEGDLFTGPDLVRLQRHLAGLGAGMATNRDAIRTLRRRAEMQPSFPDEFATIVFDRCEGLMKHTNGQRHAIRESFHLVASATAGQQFRLAEERADRDGVFQAVVGILAAVFVAPGLVAAIYGANVRGLPGYEAETGLWFMLGGAFFAAALSLLVIFAVRTFSRRRRPG